MDTAQERLPLLTIPVVPVCPTVHHGAIGMAPILGIPCSQHSSVVYQVGLASGPMGGRIGHSMSQADRREFSGRNY